MHYRCTSFNFSYLIRNSGIVGDSYKNFSIRAEVGLLSRNILIRGDESSDSSKFGAHFMAMAGIVHLSQVEFDRCGQKQLKSRYPVHFHLAGSSMIGSSLDHLAIHNSYSRYQPLVSYRDLPMQRCRHSRYPQHNRHRPRRMERDWSHVLYRRWQ